MRNVLRIHVRMMELVLRVLYSSIVTAMKYIVNQLVSRIEKNSILFKMLQSAKVQTAIGYHAIFVYFRDPGLHILL